MAWNVPGYCGRMDSADVNAVDVNAVDVNAADRNVRKDSADVNVPVRPGRKDSESGFLAEYSHGSGLSADNPDQVNSN